MSDLTALLQGLFSDQRIVQESSLAEIPLVDVKLELEDPPTREEVKKATKQTKIGKSPNLSARGKSSAR